MWLPVCLAGFVTGFGLFVAFNLTSEKHPKVGCPKLLLKMFSYQVNEHFVPMDDEMVAELCKKTIVQPDVQTREESTTVHISRLKTVDTQFVDQYIEEVEASSQPSKKVPDLTEIIKDAEQTTTAKTEEIPSTVSVLSPELSRPHLTGPPSDHRGIPKLAKDFQALFEKPKIDSIDSEKSTIDDNQMEGTQSTGSVTGYSRHYLISPPGHIMDLAKEFIAKDVQDLRKKPAVDEAIFEKSLNTSLLIEELMQNSDAKFIPYVSPFFYLTPHFHKPAVITQDLIVKPDFDDLISAGSIFPPYISPFLFFPIPTLDKLVVLKFFENKDVDPTIAGKQESEEKTLSNPQMIKRKGMPPTEDECSDISSKLCALGLNKYFIPVNETRMPEYCEALNDYYKCHVRNLEPPKLVCDKVFTRQNAEDLMMVLCVDYNSQDYKNALECAKTAVLHYYNLCRTESETQLTKIKKQKGMEIFDNENFQNCIKGFYRNECLSIGIKRKCFGENFVKYTDLLSSIGARDTTCQKV